MDERYLGLVRVIRIYLEVFVLPTPGRPVWLPNAENVAWALRFSWMKRNIVR